ncbi:MAG TPA: CsgG/HfaB family protein [Trueperaceae bacterium]|nr:CsgG/HfaB family protein [Trueperaceae bacterium]
MKRRSILMLAAVVTALVVAACAPTTGTGGADAEALSAPCAQTPPPTVAVVDFENTTGRHGTTVVGVEEAASARLITLLKESGCYVVVERSELLTIMQQQGLESMEPVALAKAAGAGYVVTGTVTRATIAEPGASVFGITLGETRADVEVDVRATDIITGEVVVSMTGTGTASSPNIAVSRIPSVGTIRYDDPTVGPLLADAAQEAVTEVVAAVRAAF